MYIQCRQLLCDEEKCEKLSYRAYQRPTRSLIEEEQKMIWNCCQAKFESSMPCSQVDGCVDDSVIINKYADQLPRQKSQPDPTNIAQFQLDSGNSIPEKDIIVTAN